LLALVAGTVLAGFGLLQVSRRVAGPAGGALLSSIVALFVVYSWVSWLSSNR
jgi:hypothetical protein